jgi:hypothetical protein
MQLESISPDDRKKFEVFKEQGVAILQEMEDLKERLKDSTKALAEEFSIKPKVLSACLRTAFKDTLADQKEQMDLIEEILEVIGHG